MGMTVASERITPPVDSKYALRLTAEGQNTAAAQKLATDSTKQAIARVLIQQLGEVAHFSEFSELELNPDTIDYNQSIELLYLLGSLTSSPEHFAKLERHPQIVDIIDTLLISLYAVGADEQTAQLEQKPHADMARRVWRTVVTSIGAQRFLYELIDQIPDSGSSAALDLYWYITDVITAGETEKPIALQSFFKSLGTELNMNYLELIDQVLLFEKEEIK